jgi:uncharacterized protein (DUF433 family)
MMVAMAALTLLDRELYDDTLAAELLNLPLRTLRWWLDGGERRGRMYEPVLRPTATGSRSVTWGEFVEARYLKEYRRTLGVELSRIRAFINFLRQELGTAYPLAHARPWVGPGRHLLWTAQQEADLPSELWACFEPHSGLQLLTHPAESYLERVEFDEAEDGIAVRLHPGGKVSPVIIDPEVRFGTPIVRGIPTGALAERVRAGDSIESVTSDFALPLEDVIAALGYENLARSEAA